MTCPIFSSRVIFDNNVCALSRLVGALVVCVSLQDASVDAASKAAVVRHRFLKDVFIIPTIPKMDNFCPIIVLHRTMSIII